MSKLIYIFLGAGVGGLLRYGLGGLAQQAWGSGFPMGTLVVNVSGCLAIGFLATAFEGPWLVREDVRMGILIGVLGGYTTFSSFGRETIQLFHDGRPATAATYVVLSNAIAIIATWIGYLTAKRLLT